MIDEKMRKKNKAIIKAASFLNMLISFGLDGIVTTNYDLLVEYSLGNNGFNYGIPGQALLGRGPFPNALWLQRVSTGEKYVRLWGQLRLSKIHGSVNNLMFTDSRNGMKGNALIIPPTYEKRPSYVLKHQ